jgi:hypothetical protein
METAKQIGFFFFLSKLFIEKKAAVAVKNNDEARCGFLSHRFQ